MLSCSLIVTTLRQIGRYSTAGVRCQSRRNQRLDGTRWRWRSGVGSQLVRHYGFQQVPRLCDWGDIERAICLSAWQDDQIPAEWRDLCSREWRWLHLGQIGSGTIYLYEPGWCSLLLPAGPRRQSED